MLTKLIKHDFRNTKTVMTLLCLIQIIIGILFGVLQFTSISNDTLEGHLQLFMLLGNPAMCAAAIIYMSKYFYNSMYSTQGYLSFTLPTTITEVVLSKIIVTCIWVAIYIMSMGLSSIITNHGISETITPYSIGTRLYFDFAFLLESISQVMIVFLSISISRIFRKHGSLKAVIFYMGLGALSLVLFIYNLSSSTEARGTWAWDYVDMFCVANFITSIILIAVSCVAAIFITNKKLNLE